MKLKKSTCKNYTSKPKVAMNLNSTYNLSTKARVLQFFARQKYLRDRKSPFYLSQTLEHNLIMPESCRKPLIFVPHLNEKSNNKMWIRTTKYLAHLF